MMTIYFEQKAHGLPLNCQFEYDIQVKKERATAKKYKSHSLFKSELGSYTKIQIKKEG